MIKQPYGVLTLHRPSNVDKIEDLNPILEKILEISKAAPVVFPVHPRTKKSILKTECSDLLNWNVPEKNIDSGVWCTGPLGYKDFLRLWSYSNFVITDSGGIQEETMMLDVPCFTLRENTERPITVEMGTNTLIKKSLAGLKEGVRNVLKKQGKQGKQGRVPEKWDGKTSERIVKIVSDYLG